MPSKKAKISQYKLNALLELTQLINTNVPIKILLNHFSAILQDLLKIGNILIYHHSYNWNVVLRKGISLSEVRKISFEKQIKPYREITHLSFLNEKKENLDKFDFIIPVLHNNKPLAYVLIGDIDEEMSGISPSIKHLQFIQTLANIIMVAIENKILFKNTIEREKLRKELEIARDVQRYLIPEKEKLAKLQHDLIIKGFYKPHSEIGGDYYDVIPINEEGYYFCIGDVSGKGIPAAILMANFQANFRALLNFSKAKSLKTIISKLNSIVLNLTKGNMFITFFIAKYDKKKRSVEYINAGHNSPFYYDSKKDIVSCLVEGTTGLGMTSECIKINYGVIKDVPKKSILLLYTDGLIEYTSDENIIFDAEYIKDTIRREKELNKIMYWLEYYIETKKVFFDDISILGIQF